MKYLLIILFSFIQILNILPVSGQVVDPNTISVIPHTSLHILFSDINDMQIDKVNRSALEVKISTKVPVTDLYASIVSDNNLNSIFPIQIGIKFSGQATPDIPANTNEILLSTIPTKILTLTKHTDDEKFSIFFDVIQHACNHFITPGDYKFSIIFSQTPQ